MTRSSWGHTAISVSLVLALVMIGCGKPPDPAPIEPPPPPAPTSPPWFEDVTERLGIKFTHDSGPVGNYSLPQVNGSGCAIADFDGDGRNDLLFLSHGGPSSPVKNQLYQQQPDKTFRDVSAGSGLDFADFCHGVAVGDLNNDGRPDVAITTNGSVHVFENLGGMKFRPLPESAGIAAQGWCTATSFLDYDRDGRLDLVVVLGVDFDPSWICAGPDGKREYCSPNVFPGAVTRLFHNESTPEQFRFQDVTVPSGLGKLPGPGLGVVCADFNGDGWTDIFVANDARPNRLWINKHDGTFVDEAPTRGAAYNAMGQAWAGMGVALADADGDGMLDLLVSHLGIETNTLWSQGPPGLFKDRTGPSGLAAGRWRGTGWGITLSDFNQDGWPDCTVVNGRVNRGSEPAKELGEYWGPYGERNQLFAGTGAGTYKDRSTDEPALCGKPNVARGLAVGDLDGDGALDLVITTVGNAARVYRNVVPERGRWLRVRCLEPKFGNRDASAALVTVVAGGRKWVRAADPGGSFFSSSDPRAHFGLGTVTALESIDIRWADGQTERFPGGPVDRDYVVRHGQGTLLPASAGVSR